MQVVTPRLWHLADIHVSRITALRQQPGSRAAPVAGRSALVNDIEMKLGGKLEVRNDSLNMPEVCWT